MKLIRYIRFSWFKPYGSGIATCTNRYSVSRSPSQEVAIPSISPGFDRVLAQKVRARRLRQRLRQVPADRAHFIRL
jgi:hypothetical protein